MVRWAVTPPLGPWSSFRSMRLAPLLRRGSYHSLRPMSMDLYLWKAPVTRDEVEAGKLVNRYFYAKEQGVFEPSPDIGAAAEELLRLYPYWPVSGEDLLASMSDEEKGRYTKQ